MQTYALALGADGQFQQALAEQSRVVEFLQKQSATDTLTFANEILASFQRQAPFERPYSANDENVFPRPQGSAKLVPHSCPTCQPQK